MSTTGAQPAPPTPGPFPEPMLVVDPGMHTAKIGSAAVDAESRWAVTGSEDKTIRIWSLADGALQRTIRVPAGPNRVGQIYSVAMSPDGALIAAGGWTQLSGPNQLRQIYLFDRESGKMVRRIEGLPSYAVALAFSPDCERLAATFDTDLGLRIFGRGKNWAEIGRDENYGPAAYGACFASDGRLATAAFDGVRVYAGDCEGVFGPTVAAGAPSGRLPTAIAFSPDGSRLAVGCARSTFIDVLDGHTLAWLSGPDCSGVQPWDSINVAWSSDGKILFAGDMEKAKDTRVILAWSEAGRSELPARADSVLSMVPLPGNELLVASADPWLARLRADGAKRWQHEPCRADFRNQAQVLRVANDGARIEFGYENGGKTLGRFDLAERKLSIDPPADSALAPAKQDGLAIANWFDTNQPALDTKLLPLENLELSRSMAIHPSGDRFVLGSDWWLRAFDAKGVQLWSWRAPGEVWAVNITGDGRLVVAACGDGVIRWLRMDNGAELLAFMPLTDQTNWVAWTPEGFYAAAPHARGVLRWHVNRSIGEAADNVAIEDIKGSFRPALLPLVLEELETTRALGRDLLEEHKLQITIRTNSRLPQAAILYPLTIGINKYNEECAKSLNSLKFAEEDAHDFAAALVATQDSLYEDVRPQPLTNELATKHGIIGALINMRKLMKKGNEDLAVVHFSGHGAKIDDKLYLLPYDVDARDTVGIQTTAVSVDELRDQILYLAEIGRVLVLLDACHSGAMTMDGTPLSLSSSDLRFKLAAANVAVLTSSSGDELSQERADWGHGAFTKALLEALVHADTDHDGLISPNELTDYVHARVQSLTEGAQNPVMESRYFNTLFAVQP